MTLRTQMPSHQSRSTYPAGVPDPFALFFDVTMPGGTALIGTTIFGNSLQTHELDDYVSVRAEVILEYERTLTELRREVLHYKRLVAELLGPREMKEEHQVSNVVFPMDDASVRIINSIVRANIPASATFRDFGEEEL